MFALIKRRYRLLSISLLFKTNYSCECARDHCLQILFLPPPPHPPHRLPSLPQQKALTAGAWTGGEDPLRPQQASISLFRLYSRVEASEQAAQWLSHPSTVPFPLQSLSLMKCGGAEATLHKPSGTVCYHWQTAITFQTGMQERCGNYWKRHDIIWREHTMLQAAFMPYLPPPASYLPASLIYRLAKPRWGSQIICVIKFILAKRTRPFIQTFFFFYTSQSQTRVRIEWCVSTDRTLALCALYNYWYHQDMQPTKTQGQKYFQTDYMHI